PTEEACRLNAYSRRQMESAKQRIRAAAAAKKKQQETGEETSPCAEQTIGEIKASGLLTLPGLWFV
ncbi:hypothetical protein CMV_028082, partial [Castanea mollissima]